jgi:hypothetical protein
LPLKWDKSSLKRNTNPVTTMAASTGGPALS